MRCNVKKLVLKIASKPPCSSPLSRFKVYLKNLLSASPACMSCISKVTKKYTAFFQPIFSSPIKSSENFTSVEFHRDKSLGKISLGKRAISPCQLTWTALFCTWRYRYILTYTVYICVANSYSLHVLNICIFIKATALAVKISSLFLIFFLPYLQEGQDEYDLRSETQIKTKPGWGENVYIFKITHDFWSWLSFTSAWFSSTLTVPFHFHYLKGRESYEPFGVEKDFLGAFLSLSTLDIVFCQKNTSSLAPNTSLILTET